MKSPFASFKLIVFAILLAGTITNAPAIRNYRLAYGNRGEAKQKKGDLDGAVADFNRAVKLGVTTN